MNEINNENKQPALIVRKAGTVQQSTQQHLLPLAAPVDSVRAIRKDITHAVQSKRSLGKDFYMRPPD